MKEILVVGGAGYIGSFVVRALLDAGYKITVLDNLSSGHKEAIPSKVTLIEADLADEKVVRDVAKGKDAAMLFSGLINVGESVKEPWRYWKENVVKMILFLEVASEIKNIIFSSSAATYGVPQGELFETHELKPVNPYGETKLAIEKYLEHLTIAKSINAVALRYFNAAGGRADLGEDHKPETHLIPNVIKAGLEGRPVTIFGSDYETKDGTCVRDYIHVEDLADAHLRALTACLSAKIGFRPYNVGTGKGVSNLEVLKATEDVLNRKIECIMGERRAGDPPVLVANPNLIKKELSWEPKFTNIKDIISSAALWHKNHPNGYLA